MNTLDVDFRRSGDSRARVRRGGHRDGIKGEFGDGFVNAMFDTGVHDRFVNFCCFWVVCGCMGVVLGTLRLHGYRRVREGKGVDGMGWVGCWKIWIWRLKTHH